MVDNVIKFLRFLADRRWVWPTLSAVFFVVLLTTCAWLYFDLLLREPLDWYGLQAAFYLSALFVVAALILWNVAPIIWRRALRPVLQYCLRPVFKAIRDGNSGIRRWINSRKSPKDS